MMYDNEVSGTLNLSFSKLLICTVLHAQLLVPAKAFLVLVCLA